MARTVTITLSHDLGKEEAARRLREGFDRLKKQMTGGLAFRFTEDWPSDDRLDFTARGLGQNISGRIDVFPQHVRIEATLPNLLASLAEIITGRMEKEGRLLLEKK